MIQRPGAKERRKRESFNIIAFKRFPTMKRRTGPRPTVTEETLDQVRLGFIARGESIADWSRERGFDPETVYRVLSGRTLALRGKSHHIAVALGIKAAPKGSMEPTPPSQGKEDRM